MNEAQRALLKEIEHKWISGVYGAASSYMAAIAALEAAYAVGAGDENEACAKLLEERGWDETARTIRARQEQGKENNASDKV